MHNLYAGNIGWGDRLRVANDVLAVVPYCGVAYNCIGELAHFRGMPPSTYIQFMRRAVANVNKNKSVETIERERVWMCRFGYSCALGELGDLQAEIEQLKLSLREKDHPQTKVMLAHHLRETDRSAAAALVLEVNATDGPLASLNGQDVRKMAADLSIGLSYDYFKDAEAVEKQADALVAEGDQGAAARKMEEAYALAQMAFKLGSQD